MARKKNTTAPGAGTGGTSRNGRAIVIRGAREHNVKDVDLAIPRDAFVVFTGLSGSGKSTLAFDTIFAEGQRRYLESLSSYARQFLGQMDKPDVDSIEGLSPAISIDQKTASHNPRSTVGTVTEVYDYLRLLWAKIGVPHCTVCNRVIAPLVPDEIVTRILEQHDGHAVDIVAPVVRARKGTYLKLLDEYYRQGFVRAYINGAIVRLDELDSVQLERYKRHDISIIVDRVTISADAMSRVFEAVETALALTEGLVSVVEPVRDADADAYPVTVYNARLACPEHEADFPEIAPRLFSFNAPQGACEACEGLGYRTQVDPVLVIPDESKTIAQGGALPWSSKGNTYMGGVLRAALSYYDIPDNVRIKDLPAKKRQLLLHGDPDEEYDEIPVRLRSAKGGVWKFSVVWRGLVGFLEERYKKTESDSTRRDIEQYMAQKVCVSCRGSRLRPEARAMTVHDITLPDVLAQSVSDALAFFRSLRLTPREARIGARIVKEIVARLGFLDEVGLGYLSLGRSAHTLSGGEMQRIRLASQIGSQLVGVLYILDEPSIGLHARDNARLLEMLLSLRDNGNSVIVIEHDEETMRAADFLVDIGLGAGKHGGQIVAAGTPEEVMAHETSLTGQYLRGDIMIPLPAARRSPGKRELVVRGATEHNLRGVNVRFPLGLFTVVTGVSGSGKSTLVEDILYRALAAKLHRSLTLPGAHRELLGTEHVDKVIMIDQSPIGRTPRSNPATYTGVFTPIRQLFATTKDARARGYTPGRFSFNVSGGRCDNCKGEGFLKIEMQFMADVYLPCDVCRGARYNSETLQVKLDGKTIADVLAMTVSEARAFFRDHAHIGDILATLEDVGLGYITLGQSATTLSGGEAQRIKLAAELSRRTTGKTVYILDEPTTGLHFEDVAKLLDVLQRLTDAGNTVIVIEHNMDVITAADWIIDLGPEGGDGGGRVVVTGPPEEVAKYHKESHTARYVRAALAAKKR